MRFSFPFHLVLFGFICWYDLHITHIVTSQEQLPLWHPPARSNPTRETTQEDPNVSHTLSSANPVPPKGKRENFLLKESSCSLGGSHLGRPAQGVLYAHLPLTCWCLPVESSLKLESYLQLLPRSTRPTSQALLRGPNVKMCNRSSLTCVQAHHVSAAPIW